MSQRDACVIQRVGPSVGEPAVLPPGIKAGCLVVPRGPSSRRAGLRDLRECVGDQILAERDLCVGHMAILVKDVLEEPIHSVRLPTAPHRCETDGRDARSKRTFVFFVEGIRKRRRRPG